LPYTPFDAKFPAIAHKETRSFRTIKDPLLKNDEFGLLELYCDEPGCDCRRVMFNVISRQQKKIVATIGYGWESAEFYTARFGSNDPDIIEELQGPVLNSMSPQTNIAPALLPHIDLVLQDSLYVDRLKRHYAMFRESIENKVTISGKLRWKRPLLPKRKKRKRR